MEHQDLKTVCEDIFEEYDITDLKVENDNVVMKVKPKKTISDELLVIFYSIINSNFNPDFWRPPQI